MALTLWEREAVAASDVVRAHTCQQGRRASVQRQLPRHDAFDRTWRLGSGVSSSTRAQQDSSMWWDPDSLLSGMQLGDAGLGRIDCGLERPERRRRLDVRRREHALDVAVVAGALVLLDRLRIGRWERRRGSAGTASPSLAGAFEVEEHGVQRFNKLLELLRCVGVDADAVLDLQSCAG